MEFQAYSCTNVCAQFGLKKINDLIIDPRKQELTVLLFSKYIYIVLP